MDQNTAVVAPIPFNIEDFELNETSQLTIQTPNGEDLIVAGQPVIFDMYGSGSPQAVKAKHKAENASTLRFQASFRGKTVNNPAEVSEREHAVRLASCTAHISSNFPVAAIDVYSNPKLGYITKQVAKWLDDDANFMKTSIAP